VQKSTRILHSENPTWEGANAIKRSYRQINGNSDQVTNKFTSFLSKN